MVEAVIDEWPYKEPATRATDEVYASNTETSKVSWVPICGCTKLAESAKLVIARMKKSKRESARGREGCRTSDCVCGGGSTEVEDEKNI